MIDLKKYFMGRDTQYSREMTPAILGAATETVRRTNLLLSTYLERTGERVDKVNSGWRPAEVNAKAGGSSRSQHLSGRAVDLSDADGRLGQWLASYPEVLEAAGLWLEHPSATPKWCHLQTVPPKSGRRVFRP